MRNMKYKFMLLIRCIDIEIFVHLFVYFIVGAACGFILLNNFPQFSLKRFYFIIYIYILIRLKYQDIVGCRLKKKNRSNAWWKKKHTVTIVDLINNTIFLFIHLTF